MFYYSVGLDYHDDTIRVCVLAEDGKMLFNRNVPNEVRAMAREVLIEANCRAADFASELR